MPSRVRLPSAPPPLLLLLLLSTTLCLTLAGLRRALVSSPQGASSEATANDDDDDDHECRRVSRREWRSWTPARFAEEVARGGVPGYARDAGAPGPAAAAATPMLFEAAAFAADEEEDEDDDGDGEWWPRTTWTMEGMRRTWPTVMFRVGPKAPYPAKEALLRDVDVASLPRGSEHVFQFGTVPASFSLWGNDRPCVPRFGFPYSYAKPIHDNATVACEFVSHMRVPRFLKGGVTVHLAGIIAGGAGASTAMHDHDAAINVLLVGEKQWILGGADARSTHASRVFTCTQRAGDVVFIPEHMPHAVVNVHESVAVQLQWHHDHFLTTTGHAELERFVRAPP